jgi:hypothetical protein
MARPGTVGAMNRTAVFAWLLAGALVLVALVAVIAKPTHWGRTALLALVLAVIAGVVGLRYARRPTGT